MTDLVEEWKAVEGFPKYQVSSFGRVQGPRKLLTPEIMPNGYCRVNLYDIGSKLKARLVHILVAKAFLGPKPTPDHEVAHWDGNKQNCRKDNLRWATRMENAADNKRQGVGAAGSGNGNAILTEEQVLEIRAVVPYSGYRRHLCDKYGLKSEEYISFIRSKRSWSHI